MPADTLSCAVEAGSFGVTACLARQAREDLQNVRDAEMCASTRRAYGKGLMGVALGLFDVALRDVDRGHASSAPPRGTTPPMSTIASSDRPSSLGVIAARQGDSGGVAQVYRGQSRDRPLRWDQAVASAIRRPGNVAGGQVRDARRDVALPM